MDEEHVIDNEPLAKELKEKWRNLYRGQKYVSDDNIRQHIRTLYDILQIDRLTDDQVHIYDDPADAHDAYKEAYPESTEWFNFCGGTADCSWAGQFELIAHESNIDLPNWEKFVSEIPECSIYCGHYELDGAWIVRAPEIIRVTDNGLHSVVGPAIKWGKEKRYYVEGVKFTENEWKKFFPEPSCSAKDILELEDSEKRSRILKYCGLEPVLDGLDYKVIDTYDHYCKLKGVKGEDVKVTDKLIEFELADIPRHYMLCKDYTRATVDAEPKRYIQGVPNDINTCKDALLWMGNFDPDEEVHFVNKS